MQVIKPILSVFFHNYYGQHEEWIEFLTQSVTAPFNLYYNIVSNSYYNFGHKPKKYSQTNSNLKKLIFRQSPNKGKDIGGKLVLLDSYLRLPEQTEYLIFLHDKKSPHIVTGAEWSQKLLKIISPSFIDKAFTHFRNYTETGIIAASDSIRNEYSDSINDFSSNNKVQLREFLSTFRIAPNNYNYVAGTMFWARSEPYVNFFSKNKPLEIRELLEAGNVLDEENGSGTHAWERLLSWVASSQGYNIKGIQ